MDPDEEEFLEFTNWTNEQQLINLDKSTYVIMGKDGKWIAVDDSFTTNPEAERYVVCESTDKYQRLIVNG